MERVGFQNFVEDEACCFVLRLLLEKSFFVLDILIFRPVRLVLFRAVRFCRLSRLLEQTCSCCCIFALLVEEAKNLLLRFVIRLCTFLDFVVKKLLRIDWGVSQFMTRMVQ